MVFTEDYPKWSTVKLGSPVLHSRTRGQGSKRKYSNLGKQSVARLIKYIRQGSRKKRGRASSILVDLSNDVKCKALVDSGAETNLIRQNVADQLLYSNRASGCEWKPNPDKWDSRHQIQNWTTDI